LGKQATTDSRRSIGGVLLVEGFKPGQRQRQRSIEDEDEDGAEI
jgi:hypothetical protein